uniref:(-)-germacrene D synthase-like isoform X2 n=1 Tax=Fragaria vesca subsp. vesca TaxID=101020 RepID=UPI0005C9B746|nr:PREDICTED: (-)-germacrene D synthase-like isoform X2 [Fragaria vesca subsp. vesca]XP_011458435.1 PREDICTED: (-)-germacrene D synthase-like isoform X2 [Fragaria vesca subsp. vesca]
MRLVLEDGWIGFILNFHAIYMQMHFKETNMQGKQQVIQQLKEEVKRMLMAPPVETGLGKLELIDDIQRLGVSYHFEYEIDQTMQQIHENLNGTYDDDDLHTCALRFRLLRQHGYNVSCDMFNKFKDCDGKFDESLHHDVAGLQSLYEATHLRVRGEDFLEEALAFTTTHLQSAANRLSPPLSKQVRHALNQPLRKGLPRLEARHYMSLHQELHGSRNHVLLRFAKLDFNLLQQVHQKELSDIARWWKKLDFASKLPFARDRVIECYFWILGVYFEPKYYFARRTLTKVIAMTSIIDDIYDVYGTLEELDLFTRAIERWDISAMDVLPEYMKFCYEALLDVYAEAEQGLASEGKSYRIDYAKEAMKRQVRAYHAEAKWFHNNYTPTMDEYMEVALVTSAYSMLATTSFVGMGDIVTKDSFEWIFSDPKMVKASAVVCRLMDDIVSHKFEQKRGHVASAVECYMIQYGATEEETIIEFRKQVSDAWKDINEECLHPTSVNMPLLMRVLNLTRVIDVLYKSEDGYTHAGTILKDFVASLLVDPVTV